MVAPGSDTSSSAGVCACTAKPGTELGADPSSRSAFATPDGNGAGRSARTYSSAQRHFRTFSMSIGGSRCRKEADDDRYN